MVFNSEEWYMLLGIWVARINYLTLDEVKRINGLLGCRGMISEGNLAFVLDEVKDLHISIERKATTLIYKMIQAHPFLDCNKRTAFVAMQIFLRRNGRELTYNEATEYILKNLLYEISNNTIKYEEVEYILVGLIK